MTGAQLPVRVTACIVFLLATAGMLVLNLSSHGRVLGHTMDDDSPIGHMVMGDDYGWPFTYRTIAFDGGHYDDSHFNSFEYGPLIVDAVIYLFAVAAILVAGEMAIAE